MSESVAENDYHQKNSLSTTSFFANPGQVKWQLPKQTKSKNKHHFFIPTFRAVAPLAISIDGFEKIFDAPHITLKVTNLEISKEKKYLLKICLIYINSFSKIDGFVEPSSQIDGFGRTIEPMLTEPLVFFMFSM